MGDSLEVKKDIVILYHAGCTDGFSAAWAAWKKFGQAAEYVAMPFRSLPPRGVKGREVYIVDYYFPEEITGQLVKESERVVIIDHHITGEVIAKMAHDYLFDIGHSGAVLAWYYFHPQKLLPRLLGHVEDMDLWKFKLPHTKEIIAYLDSVDFSFNKWDEAMELGEKPEGFDKIVEKGSVILKYQDSLIKAIIGNSVEEVEFESHRALAVNSPVFNSQIGSKLAEEADIGIVWVQNKRGVKYSLRSRGEINVAELAARFPEGGGHKNAAGFVLLPGSKHPWRK